MKTQNPIQKNLPFFVIFLILVLFFLIIISEEILAGEFDNPRPEWIFYSGWETAIGSTEKAITDDGRWGEYKYVPNLKVINNPPSGGPNDGNVLRIHWTAYDGRDCSDGSNNFVEHIVDDGEFPNPMYMRVYFYSEDPSAYPGCAGRKFFQISDAAGRGGTVGLYLYDVGNNRVGLTVKNFQHNGGGDNCPTCYYLNGGYQYPGQEDVGIIEKDRWYCVEFAVYRHNTNGWVKVWLDGKLVINASKEAWGTGRYDTQAYDRLSNWLEMPSYRNGGTKTDHYEYFDSFIISRSHIGPVSSSESDDSPNPPPH